MLSVSIISLVMCLQLLVTVEALVDVDLNIGLGGRRASRGDSPSSEFSRGRASEGPDPDVKSKAKGRCSVSLKATGMYDSNLNKGSMSQISVNGKEIFHTAVPPDNGRGFNLVLLNRVKCTGDEYTTYDIYADNAASQRLVTYLNGLPTGTIILGVTSNTAAHQNLGQAKATLKSMGVDVDTLGAHEKVLFVIEKGTLPAMKFLRSAKGQPVLEYEHTF